MRVLVILMLAASAGFVLDYIWDNIHPPSLKYAASLAIGATLLALIAENAPKRSPNTTEGKEDANK